MSLLLTCLVKEYFTSAQHRNAIRPLLFCHKSHRLKLLLEFKLIVVTVIETKSLLMSCKDFLLYQVITVSSLQRVNWLTTK